MVWGEKHRGSNHNKRLIPVSMSIMPDGFSIFRLLLKAFHSIAIFISLSIAACPAADAQIHQTWQQSSSTDFLQGTLCDLIVTHSNDGEVRLLFPLWKSFQDTLDLNLTKRFISVNKWGNYVRAWTSRDSVYVQKFSGNDVPLTSPITVNDPGKPVQDYDGYTPSCLMNNGYYYVAWQSADSEANVYGQLFDNGDHKVGGNLRISEFPNTWRPDPAIIADEKDSTFLIIMACRKSLQSDSSDFWYRKLNLDGGKEGTAQRFQWSYAQSSVRGVAAVFDKNGKIILGWIGSNSIYGGEEETVFVQKFDRGGYPLNSQQIVNDALGGGNAFLHVCTDTVGRYLLVWADSRNQPINFTADIYAQLYDTNDHPVGNNIRINSPVGNSDTQEWRPDARWSSGQYLISWTTWNESARRYDPYYNKWSYNLSTQGTLVSSIHDAGPLIQSYQTVQWNAGLQEDTRIKFQLRSAASLDELDTASWYGPTAEGDYYTVSGSSINTVHNSKRYLQYKAFLESGEWGNTLLLEDISVDYTLAKELQPLPPTSFAATPGRMKIALSWKRSLSPAVVSYRIYRGTRTQAYDTSWVASDTGMNSAVDTSVMNETMYYYTIAAIDSNLLQSQYAPEISVSPIAVKLYVSSTSSIYGTGSPWNPFPTIQSAIENSFLYDTVFVLPGVYEGPILAKNKVSVIGSGPRFTTIQAGGAEDVIDLSQCRELSYFTIKQSGSVHWAAINCDTSSVLVSNNVITNVTGGSNAAILSWGGTPRFIGNYIVGFDVGIQVTQGLYVEEAPRALITNNTIIGGTVCLDISNESDVDIVNNTLISGKSPHCISVQLAHRVNIRNNILQGYFNQWGIGIDIMLTDIIQVSYNDVWEFQTPYSGEFSQGPGNVSQDPLFVDEPGSDYRLSDSSRCRDAGDPDSRYNDCDSSRNDMGAFGGPHPINPHIFGGMPIVIAVDRIAGFPGDTVVVHARLEGAKRFSKGSFAVTYRNEIVKLLSVEKGSCTSEYQLAVDTVGTGNIGISLSSSGTLGVSSGDIFQMTFRISPMAVSGEASPLTFASIVLYDSTGLLLPLQEIRHGIIALNAGSAGGRYVYVDQTNAGTQDGTRHHPYRSIQAAITAAVSGDTVIVGSGFYQGCISLKDSIHIRGSGPTVTTARGDSLEPPSTEPTFKVVRSKGVSISGLTILATPGLLGKGIVCDSSDARISDNHIALTPSQNAGWELIEIKNGSNAWISDNYIEAAQKEVEAYVSVNRSYVDIQRNILGSPEGEGGITVQGHSHGTIGNNRITFGGSLLNAGISIDECSRVAVHNNLIMGGRLQTVAIKVNNSDNITVVNNTLDTKFRGIEETSSKVDIMNNIVTGNSGYGISVGTQSTLLYNDVWQNSPNYYETVPGTYDISVDPMFVDAQLQNYDLLVGSPCRDAGNPSPTYNDLDGTRNDIGLYGGPFWDTLMFPARCPMLVLGNTLVNSRDTFFLPLTGQCIRNLAGSTIQISFDVTMLNFLGAATTLPTAPLSLTYTSLDGGKLVLGLAGSVGVTVDSSCLLELRFESRGVTGTTEVQFQMAQLYATTSVSLPIVRLSNGQVGIGVLGVDSRRNSFPLRFSLSQNYPNPFNPCTSIRYALPHASRVNISVFNILGQKIATLVDGIQDPGEKSVMFYGQSLPSGVYLCRMQAANYVFVKKMLMLK